MFCFKNLLENWKNENERRCPVGTNFNREHASFRRFPMHWSFSQFRFDQTSKPAFLTATDSFEHENGMVFWCKFLWFGRNMHPGKVSLAKVNKQFPDASARLKLPKTSSFPAKCCPSRYKLMLLCRNLFVFIVMWFPVLSCHKSCKRPGFFSYGTVQV